MRDRQSLAPSGRLTSLSYPSGLVLNDGYTASGDLSQVTDNSSGLAYWAANSADAELQVTSETFGNGATETQTFDPATGRLTGVTAGSNNGIAKWQYTWDGVGNRLSRTDTIEGYSEYFCYDQLNRLTTYAIGSSCTASGACDQHRLRRAGRHHLQVRCRHLRLSGGGPGPSPCVRRSKQSTGLFRSSEGETLLTFHRRHRKRGHQSKLCLRRERQYDLRGRPYHLLDRLQYGQPDHARGQDH